MTRFATFIIFLLLACVAQADILVTTSNSVERYSDDGNFIETFSSSPDLFSLTRIRFGVDGNVYVIRNGNSIVKLEYPSGDYLGNFLLGGDVTAISDFRFGPFGDLFLVNGRTLKQFDGTTGLFLASVDLPVNFVDTFRFVPNAQEMILSGDNTDSRPVLARIGLVFENTLLNDVQEVYATVVTQNMSFSVFGFAFGDGVGAEGDVYLSFSPNSNNRLIRRYDAATGSFLQDFATGTPTLYELEFDPDDNLRGSTSNSLRRYDGMTGQFLNEFAMPTRYFTFAPDISTAITVVPNNFLISRGQYSAGSTADLALSDDMDVTARRQNSDLQSRVYLEVTGVSTIASPTTFSFTLEAAVFARSTVIQSVDLFNYSTGEYEEVDSRPARMFTDASIDVTPAGNLEDFVESGSNLVKARVRFNSENQRQRFAANVDQTIWRIDE